MPDTRISAPLASAALMATLAVGCGGSPPPPAAPSVAATEASTSSPTASSVAASAGSPQEGSPQEGSPQIVNSAAGLVHIQYRVYGSGEPLVVLIHGWSCDSNYWSAQIADLKSRYSVVTVDLAGHGGSGANRSDWSMGAFGDDVAAVVNALPQHPKVILIGHSMGGPVAVEAARRLQSRVVGVIGVDTFKSVGAPPPPAAETAARMKAFETDFIGNTRTLVTTSFFTKNSDPALVRRIADDMSQAPPAVAVPAVRALNSWDGVTAMKALKVPIIAVNSDLGPPTRTRDIRKFAPTFDAVIVDGLGHFLMMEDPQRVNPILDAQIQKILATPPG